MVSGSAQRDETGDFDPTALLLQDEVIILDLDPMQRTKYKLREVWV
jgi:hypothetical protein